MILFGAVNGIFDTRKGFDLLQAAIKQIRQKRDDIELVVFGSSQPEDEYDLGCKSHYMGRIHDEKMISLIYNTANVFVVPSRDDNLPNTILESLSCGIPTVSFQYRWNPRYDRTSEKWLFSKTFLYTGSC